MSNVTPTSTPLNDLNGVSDLDIRTLVLARANALAAVLTEKIVSKYPGQHTFMVETPRGGARYVRISQTRDGVTPQSVHCFVELSTGNVFKPAGYKGPAKHVRANLLDEAAFKVALERCDVYGSWLYIR